MLEMQTKIKRQIEIIGLISNSSASYRAPDLAEIFGCEELTIKRDLQELRAAGIDIHSERTKGICIGSPVNQKLITELVLQYVGICYSQNAVDKTTSLMVRKKKMRALHDVVHFQRAIEKHLLTVIDYEKEKDEIEKNREIGPLLIFQSEGLYRLLALHDGKIKQYHLNKILSLRITQKKFRPVDPQAIEDMFRYSWKSWLGNERHTVKILYSKEWMNRRNPRSLMDAEAVVENEDGSATITVTVNSLDELASWIASRGEGVKVLEPDELRNKVIAIGRGLLGNYTNP